MSWSIPNLYSSEHFALGLFWCASHPDSRHHTVSFPQHYATTCSWTLRYQAQVTLLASILRPVYGKDMEIGTVDGMQGREKDAVIISLVRSNEKVNAFTVFFWGLNTITIARGWIPQGQTQA